MSRLMQARLPRLLTFEQFLPMWMRKNNICVLFISGEPEAKKAYRKYAKTRVIPKEAA